MGLKSTFLRAISVALLAPVLGVSGHALPAKAAQKIPAQRPSVVLITIDTLRADHVGCYGSKNVKTPTLDALAADGVVFERAISQVPLTWPSHAVILTGTYPFQNGVQDFTGEPLSPQFRSVAQAFKSAGYRTGAVISAFVLDRSWGLARGFDVYDDAFSAKTFQTKDIGLVDRRAEESVEHAIEWLKKPVSGSKVAPRTVSSQKPFFLWLHLYDPHSPYDPPEPYRTEYRDHPYDGEIAYADHELGKLIEWLRQNKLYDSSLVVVLSDHGESLGEHGEDEHGFFIYNATVHVPLIVKPPTASGIRPGRRQETVETTNVAPSLLEVARVKDPIETQFQSQSLFAANVPGQRSSYSETFYPFSSFGWSPLRAIETDRFHYIDAPKPELYDMQSDPEEKNNIADAQSATVSVLKERLQRVVAHNPFAHSKDAAASLSPEAQEKLRALGYFGFRAAVSPQELAAGLADPKDKVSEFNTILKAEDAFHQGDDARGETLLVDVQKRDPKIYVIPYLLGEMAIRHEDWQRAADELQRCLELNPSFDNAMTGLARAMVKLDRPDEAGKWLNKAIENNPQNYRAWYELGLLQAKGDPEAALTAYQKAIAIQPNFPPGQREVGLALYQHKNYEAAAEHLEKAVALGMDDAKLLNFLGICYSRTNELPKAVKNYRAALKLDPALAEAHLNLAFALQRQHEGAAMAEYKEACKLDERFCAYVPAK